MHYQPPSSNLTEFHNQGNINHLNFFLNNHVTFTSLPVRLHRLPSSSCLFTHRSVFIPGRALCDLSPLALCPPPPPIDAELEPDQTSAPSGQAGEPSTSQQAKAEQRTAGGAGEQPNTAKVHGKTSFCGVGQILTRCTLCSMDDHSLFYLLRLDSDKEADVYRYTE